MADHGTWNEAGDFLHGSGFPRQGWWMVRSGRRQPLHPFWPASALRSPRPDNTFTRDWEGLFQD